MTSEQTVYFPLSKGGSDPLITLKRNGHVFQLIMHSGKDNRFNPKFVQAMNQALDHIETYAYPPDNTKNPCALITTATSQKFYSNGLDIKYLFESVDLYFISDQFLALLQRMLLFPMITVAAINGHCFAGGLLFALWKPSHDYRVLRADKGLLSMNEIDLPSSLHPGMAAICRSKLTPQVFHHLVFGPKRYGGQDALNAGLVDSLASEHELVPTATKIAQTNAAKASHAGRIMTQLKQVCYADIVSALQIRAQIDVRQFMRPKM